MKLKNIFIVLSATLFAFVACVDEVLMEPSNQDVVAGIPTSINLTIDADGVMTKAAPGYTYATPDEIKIQNLAIAVFEVRTVGTADVIGERLGFSYGTYDNSSSSHTEDGQERPQYEMKNVPAKTGKVKILALANSTYTEAELSAATTYTAFSGLTEQNKKNGEASFEFDPAWLVKFGEKETTLGLNSSVHLRLTQLAARIDVAFEVNVPAFESVFVIDSAYTMADLVEIAQRQPPATEYYWEENRGQGKYLAVKNTIEEKTISPVWDYQISSVTIHNINTGSEAFLSDYVKSGATYDPDKYTYNSQSIILETPYAYTMEEGSNKLFFYTYEKAYTAENVLKVQVEGTLENRVDTTVVESQTVTVYKWSHNGWGGSQNYFMIEDDPVEIYELPAAVRNGSALMSEERKYQLTIDPKEGTNDANDPWKDCNTYGVVHGNTYEVKGLMDIQTQTINFTYTQKPWEVRITEVDIVPVHYLQVTDRVISMPNQSSATTTFYSSSYASIKEGSIVVKKVTENGEEDDDSLVSIFIPEETNDGVLTISAAVPTNFVPQKIYFTVTNENGLEQSVVVTQYPPLYITFEKSGSVGDGSSGQTNYNYYKFTSLVANFSSFPDPNEFDEAGRYYGDREYNWTEGVQHTTALPALGRSYASYIRSYGTSGYPKVDAEGATIDTDENNRLISPTFMLASQAGTNTAATYADRREWCKHYTEKDKDGTVLTGWRMATLNEVYVIDVLQNVRDCVVKKILEGNYYWSADKTNPIQFMDHRVDASDANAGATRCVRDIK